MKNRASLAAELDRVEREVDVISFSDKRQDALLQRLADVQATMQANAKDPEMAQLADKVRLLSGTLAWELSSQWSDRLWQARKALRDTDSGLEQARMREATLAKAQREEPQRFERFAKRIDALEAQINALIPRVAALTTEQQQAVQGIAVAELTMAQERLAAYQTQARFALAQLYDRASLATNAKEGSDAPRR
jgi:chromosome segregation ATPase